MKIIKCLATFAVVLVHTVLLFIYSTYGVQNGLQMYFALSVFGVLLGISSVYHVLLWFFTRKRGLSAAVRIPLYLLPVTSFLLLGWILPAPPQLPNQQQTLASPSKRYIMKMDMQHNRWIVNISDSDGKKLYRDNRSDFHGQFNVYWIWDNRDRLWLYNSDDGRIYYWMINPAGWSKTLWDDNKKSGISPPGGLYPDYLKEQ